MIDTTIELLKMEYEAKLKKANADIDNLRLLVEDYKGRLKNIHEIIDIINEVFEDLPRNQNLTYDWENIYYADDGWAYKIYKQASIPYEQH